MQRFFSIVVPCYNEESIIHRTLNCLDALVYPKSRYEIIVVENGSSDNTYAMAKKHESGNCRVLQSEKGVSRARNLGFENCTPEMEWVIFLDADTFLEPNILTEINIYLNEHPDADFGTTDVYLDDETRTGKFWSCYINVTDRFIRIMHRIHIVRRELAQKIRYDEELESGEDLHYSKELGKIGLYFYMQSDQVITSARRFLKKGYWTMFFLNMKSALPKKLLKNARWETIR